VTESVTEECECEATTNPPTLKHLLLSLFVKNAHISLRSAQPPNQHREGRDKNQSVLALLAAGDLVLATEVDWRRNEGAPHSLQE